LIHEKHTNTGDPFVLQEIKQKKKQTKGMTGTWYYMGAAGEIGFAIALPIAGGAILGSWLDQKSGTYPRYTLSLLVTGIVLSVINFYFIIKAIIEKEK